MLDTPVRSTTALLVYGDVAAAQDYLVYVLALSAGPRDVDDNGLMRHAEVRAGDQASGFTRPRRTTRSPASLGTTTAMTAVVDDDADVHHARAAGANIVEEPTDEDYGVREYGARDLEGHLWFFHSPTG